MASGIPYLYGFFILINLLDLLPLFNGARPAKDKRESVCLNNAVKFYNITMDFEERVQRLNMPKYLHL
jgi:hypothetical protein